MIPMIGYDVSYRRDAFRTKNRRRTLETVEIEALLKNASSFVQRKSNGRWLVVNKSHYVPSDDEATIEFMVIVPQGSDQREQMLAAIQHFEESVATHWLTGPVDTNLRTIEGNGPKCEECGGEPIWVRRTQLAGDHYFCNPHALQQSDFGDPIWKDVVALTT